MAQPIWKDCDLVLGTMTDSAYTIRDNSDNILYSGHAYRRPGETSIKVRINDIARAFLYQDLPPVDATAFNTAHVYRNFRLCNSAGTEADAEPLWLDWSYEPGRSVGLSADASINGRISEAAPFIWTVYAGATITWGVDGATDTVLAADGGNFVVEADDLAGGKVLRINYGRWDIVEACHRWVLYYVNAYGGWDEFVIETDSLRRTDTYDRATIRRRIDNGDALAAETSVIRNGVTRSWEFHTGWLSDAQSARMHHMLGTTLAYLHDTVDGTFTPVMVTNGDAPRKTYRGEGAAMVDYVVTLQDCNPKERR